MPPRRSRRVSAAPEAAPAAETPVTPPPSMVIVPVILPTQNGHAIPQAIAAAQEAITSATTTRMDAWEQLIATRMPNALATLRQTSKVLDVVHEVFFGPLLRNTSELRAYFCSECCWSNEVKPGPDDRKHQRLTHVINNHASLIAAKVDAKLRADYGAFYGSPVAALMKEFGLAQGPSARHDEAAVAFMLFSKRSIPFSAIECPLMRLAMPFSSVISTKMLVDAGKSIAAKNVARVTAVLPNKFGIVFDSWKSFSRNYICVFAVFPEAGNARYELLALRPLIPESAQLIDEPSSDDEFEDPVVDDSENEDDDDVYERLHPDSSEPTDSIAEPTVDDFRMGEELYSGVIRRILQDFKKNERSVIFFMADNCPLNKAIARGMAIPLIGCHAHLLNLGIKKWFEPHASLLRKVHNLCTKLRTNNRFYQFLARLKKLPKVASLVRWRSTIQMLESYLAFRPLLPEADARIARYIPTSTEHDAIVALIARYNSGISAALLELDRKHVALSDARLKLDELLQDDEFAQAMGSIIGEASTVLTPEGARLALLARKIATSGSLALSESEKITGMPFVRSAHTAELPPLPGVRTDRVYDMMWVPSTSSEVERTFSVLKHLLIAERTAITHENLECQLFARAIASNINFSIAYSTNRLDDREFVESMKRLVIHHN